MKNFGVEGLYTNICKTFSIPAGTSAEETILNACQNEAFNAQALRDICTVMAGVKSVTDKKHALILQKWLDASPEERQRTYNTYKTIYLTTKNEPRKTLVTKDVIKLSPEGVEALNSEAQRILALEETINAILIATLTRDLFLLGAEILEQFETLKTEKSALDFDDLILKTLDLLEGTSMNMTAQNIQRHGYALS